MKTKTKKKVSDKMVDTELQKGNTPLTLDQIIESLKEYQSIQRGGYWPHDKDKDGQRIKEWHRAIDAAIYTLEAVAKTDVLVTMWKAVMSNGDYPKIVPSAKSLKLEAKRFGK